MTKNIFSKCDSSSIFKWCVHNIMIINCAMTQTNWMMNMKCMKWCYLSPDSSSMPIFFFLVLSSLSFSGNLRLPSPSPLPCSVLWTYLSSHCCSLAQTPGHLGGWAQVPGPRKEREEKSHILAHNLLFAICVFGKKKVIETNVTVVLHTGSLDYWISAYVSQSLIFLWNAAQR